MGDDGPLLLPREEPVRQILDQLARWRETRADGSLVLLGEKGQGKTTLLALTARKVKDIPCVRHVLARKVYGPAELAESLAPALGMDPGISLEALARGLQEGPERVILLDEAHNTFLRVVGGFSAFDSLVRLVNDTSHKVFWVLVFNSFSWQFINETRKRVHYFRRLLPLPRWKSGELQDLIGRRNRRTGFELEFDELLLDAPTGAERSGFQLVEGAEGYFRLLREASEGNPRLATYLWLHSLQPVGPKKLRVRLFSDPVEETLDKLDPELLFALAAICQHENLSASELARTLNVTESFASFALRFLGEHGFLEPKGLDPARSTLAPRYYHQILQALRARHLLFELR